MVPMETVSPNQSISGSKSNQRVSLADVRSGITDRQLETLVAIAALLKKNVYSPSYAEIGRSIGVSSQSSVFKAIAQLQKRGLVAKTPYVERSIVLTNAGRRVLRNYLRREK
jgi:Mn-dependent DtxR family transcriptional regulator